MELCIIVWKCICVINYTQSGNVMLCLAQETFHPVTVRATVFVLNATF